MYPDRVPEVSDGTTLYLTTEKGGCGWAQEPEWGTGGHKKDTIDVKGTLKGREDPCLRSKDLGVGNRWFQWVTGNARADGSGSK